MAILRDEHAVVTFENRDLAPRHSLEKRALDAVRDAIIGKDTVALDTLRAKQLPEGWDPRFAGSLAAMATKVVMWDEQRKQADTRPGDTVGFNGMAVSPERLAAQRVAAGETTDDTHGKIGFTLMLRFVLATIADREEREIAARAAETQVLPVPEAPAPAAADADLVARHANGSSTRPLTLDALTRLGATHVGNTPTVIISTTNLSALRPVSPAVGN